MRPAHDKSYFHFTKKERTGILSLTALAVVSVIISIGHSYFFKAKPSDGHVYTGDIAKLEAKAIDTASSRHRYTRAYKAFKSSPAKRYSYSMGELFFFDPNKISEKEWRRLGLRDKTISIIMNYLSKGGRFREPSDLKKIWGLQEELANRIIPYARIAGLESQPYRDYSENARPGSYVSKKYEAVDINEGDTTALAKLPGIGPKLSQRIIKYRDRLGGFYAVDQVAETFGLPDSTFKKIRTWLKVEKEKIKTININTATLEELKVHPYIRYHLANALVQYRQQHKAYSSVNEIRNIMLVDDTTFQKVAPYLVVE